MPVMEKWRENYHLAALETDRAKMHERITLARKSIEERLLQLSHGTEQDEEREGINGALRALRVLEADTKRW
jgi:hypothetical protein